MPAKQNAPAAIIVERDSYKGSPVIVLKRFEGDRFPFSFGLSKAKLVLAAAEDIQQFVAEHSQNPNGGAG